MPNSGAKVSSAYVSPDELREFAEALPSVFRELFGDRSFSASYGWGCNIHVDLWYKPMCVGPDGFRWLIEDSTEQKIFEFGNSDLLIDSPDSTMQITICHESDIHLDGSDDESIRKIVARFPNLDFRTAEQWDAAYRDYPKEQPSEDDHQQR
jgi:hypothetical protein